LRSMIGRAGEMSSDRSFDNEFEPPDEDRS